MRMRERTVRFGRDPERLGEKKVQFGRDPVRVGEKKVRLGRDRERSGANGREKRCDSGEIGREKDAIRERSGEKKMRFG